MKISSKLQMITLMIMLPGVSQAFESGSTGTDGALTITADTKLARPTGGVFNFTSVNIAPGFTLTFTGYHNAPVILLASGDVVIGGTIDISGEDSGSIQADFSIGGAFVADGGPGGFDGGHAGAVDNNGIADSGGNGLGLGGGKRGRLGPERTHFYGDFGCGGGGGGFGTAGAGASFVTDINSCNTTNAGTGGQSYGIANLLPLFGGSGGGGGSGGRDSSGTGGGGGGGALLIASSTTVQIDGSILADGGDGGNSNVVCGSGNSSQLGGTGGGGSGGGIRIIADTITGSGNISATGGMTGLTCNARAGRGQGGAGGLGRIRLEAEVSLEFSNTSPALSFGGPAPVFATNIPSITIASVAGIAAPSVTTGLNDIILPQNTVNPTIVKFSTNEIPAGKKITLKAIPVSGVVATADSTPIATNGTASVSINLPSGPSILIASTTFTVVASLGADFSKYAQGEQVEKVRVGMTAEGQSETTFITISGKEFTMPSNTVAMQ